MKHAVGEILPLAVGVAISPLPILALVLMLLARRARVVAPAFALGWVVGLTAVALVGLFVGSSLSEGDSGPERMDTVRIVLGAVLILTGIREWRRHRAAAGAEGAHEPRWLTEIQSPGPGRAIVLGAALAGVNPKNLILGLAAGATIGQTPVSGAKQAGALAVYVILGASTILGPLLLYLAGGERARNVVSGWRDWLAAHGGAVLAVVMVVLGAVVLGKGITGS